jgi:hypothetical protein
VVNVDEQPLAQNMVDSNVTVKITRADCYE